MEELAENIYVETGYEGVNVGAIVTKAGIICLDAPSYPRDARHWVTRLSQLNPRPIRFLILTNAHGDRILNTRWLDAPLITHRDAAEKLNNYDKRYPQNFLDSLGHRNPIAGRELVNGPVDRAAISFDQSMTVVADNYHIKLYHMPGPTSGNIWAYIPEAGVLFTGDSVVVNDYPLLAEICCTDWLCTLEEALQRFDVRYLVPGRGPVSPPEMAVQPMREYLAYIEDSVRQQILDGKNRETMAALEESLLTKFPIGDLPRDWVQKQIKLGLERVYNEIKSGMEVVLI